MTEATWQDHTAIFHSHSSAFAHDFKRYPSPKEAFQQTLFANFSNLSLPFGVSARAAQKGPPPSAVATVVVIVPVHGKHVRQRRRRPFPPTMHHSRIKPYCGRDTGCVCFFFRGGAVGFSPPFHLRFDSTQYPCGVFESELKNHTNA